MRRRTNSVGDCRRVRSTKHAVAMSPHNGASCRTPRQVFEGGLVARSVAQLDVATSRAVRNRFARTLSSATHWWAFLVQVPNLVRVVVSANHEVPTATPRRLGGECSIRVRKVRRGVQREWPIHSRRREHRRARVRRAQQLHCAIGPVHCLVDCLRSHRRRQHPYHECRMQRDRPTMHSLQQQCAEYCAAAPRKHHLGAARCSQGRRCVTPRGSSRWTATSAEAGTVCSLCAT